LPALLPAPPTAFFTASTLECLLDEPFERDLLLLALLLDELRALLPADFFAAFGLALDAFGFAAFDVDFGFDVDRFFGLAFVWAIVPLSWSLFPSDP
jgi:hypothetical protein